jgi:DNA-binding Lrp family transcriptional regulator
MKWNCSSMEEKRRFLSLALNGYREMRFRRQVMQNLRTKILRLLQNNSKMSHSDMAVVLGVDESVVKNTIQDMEQEQIICGYNTVINWDKTDDERVTALIEVKVEPQRGEGFDRVAERIYNYEEVTSLYLMSGGFDMTVLIEGKTMKEVAQFVARKLAPMEGILSTSTHFVLKKYKEAGTKIEQHKKDERQAVTA